MYLTIINYYFHFSFASPYILDELCQFKIILFKSMTHNLLKIENVYCSPRKNTSESPKYYQDDSQYKCKDFLHSAKKKPWTTEED